MRIRAAAAASLLALALLSACSDDDDPAVDASASGSASDVEAEATDDEATVDQEELEDEPAASDADAQAAIDAAQLDAEDLGEGFALTSTKPAGEDDEDDEPNPIDDCMTTDLDDRFEDATVAETEERTFTRQDGGAIPTEVSASNVALSDGDLFDEMHELLRSDEFGACMGTAFEELVAESAGGAEITLGELDVREDVVDPDAADDLTSTGIDIPVSVSSDGFTLDVEVTMAFLNTGELGSSILVFGATDERRDQELAEWGRLVAERLADA
jgi:hypothetical protein